MIFSFSNKILIILKICETFHKSGIFTTIIKFSYNNSDKIMISHVYIKNLSNHVGKSVTLKGWLFNKRSSGKVKFLILRDGSGYLQCIVFKGNVTEEVFQLADSITQESSFEITGIVKT